MRHRGDIGETYYLKKGANTEASSPWDEPLFGQYLRALKNMRSKLPKLRRKPRYELPR